MSVWWVIQLEEEDWLHWQGEEASLVKVLEKMIMAELLEDTAREVQAVLQNKEDRVWGRN